jgi:hypothetical chaperone protein
VTTVVGYGIDFGTTNSAVAAAYDDGTVKVLPVNGQGDRLLGSLIYLERSGNRLAGREAVQTYLVDGTLSTRCGSCDLVDRRPGATGTVTECRQYVPGSGCQDSRLLAQIKSDLSSDGLDRTHSWGVDFLFSDLVAIVLRRLKREADRRTGQDVRRVAVGHPVRFPGVDLEPARLQRLAEERLHHAARTAGFDEVVLVAESRAAVAVEEVDDGIVLCTDFGGGTFDVALLEKSGRVGRVQTVRGVAIGGEEFDSRIFEAKVAPALSLDQSVRDMMGKEKGLPRWMQQEFRSMAGLKRLLTDPQVGAILRELAATEGGEFALALRELLYGGQAYHCYQAIERAKVSLSTEAETRITLRRGPHLDLDVPFSRAEFEVLIGADLRRVRHCIEDALEDADVLPEDVSYVTRTGGSSQIPAFRELLDDLFGPEKIVERDPFDTVVSGLARCAYGEWRDVA